MEPRVLVTKPSLFETLGLAVDIREAKSRRLGPMCFYGWRNSGGRGVELRQSIWSSDS